MMDKPSPHIDQNKELTEDQKTEQFILEVINKKQTGPDSKIELRMALERAKAKLQLLSLDASQPQKSLRDLLIEEYKDVRKDEKSLAEKLMSIVRHALEAKKFELEADSARKVDNLTQLFNRSALFECLAKVLKSERSNDRPFSVLMLDFDHFKAVNDTYGHVIGDMALENFAKVLLESVRTNQEPGKSSNVVDGDLVFRYAGDEFAIIVRGGGEAAVKKIIERIRKKLAGPLVHIDDVIFITVSTSIGWVSSDQFQGGQFPRYINETNIVSMADAAMYIAKKKRGSDIKFVSGMEKEIAKVE
jgi:diguanylate cyclase (GGDEF)-like protein